MKTKAPKTNREIIVRPPTIEDLPMLYEYFQKINKEKTFITIQNEKITFEDEKKFLESTIELIKQKKKLYLLVQYKNEIIGSCDLIKENFALKHTALFGIIIAKKARGEGIGKLLMKIIFREARKTWKDLRIIRLEVFGNNTTAQKLYKKMGFIECGKVPKGAYYRHRLVDRITMYKQLR